MGIAAEVAQSKKRVLVLPLRWTSRSVSGCRAPVDLSDGRADTGRKDNPVRLGRFTTDLLPPLKERGIMLSTSQFYRLVVERPGRLSLKILMALMDILECTMDDLIEPVTGTAVATKPKKAAAGGTTVAEGIGGLRPERARIRGVDR